MLIERLMQLSLHHYDFISPFLSLWLTSDFEGCIDDLRKELRFQPCDNGQGELLITPVLPIDLVWYELRYFLVWQHCGHYVLGSDFSIFRYRDYLHFRTKKAFYSPLKIYSMKRNVLCL